MLRIVVETQRYMTPHIMVLDILVEKWSQCDNKLLKIKTQIKINWKYSSGRIPVIQVLVSYGADLSKRNKYGRTARGRADSEGMVFDSNYYDEDKITSSLNKWFWILKKRTRTGRRVTWIPEKKVWISSQSKLIWKELAMADLRWRYTQPTQVNEHIFID